MIEYNKWDVHLLYEAYMKMRPWMTNHPNMNVFDGRPACKVCRSKRVARKSYKMTVAGRKVQYQCQDCGHWMIGEFENPGIKYR
jgi:hypothetical protein